MRFPNIGRRLVFVAMAVPVAWLLINADFSIMPRSIAVVYPGHVLGIFLAFLACYEYIGMLRQRFPANGFWISYVWLAMQFILYLTDNQLPYHLGLYLLVMLVAVEAFAWGRFDKKGRWLRASLLFSGVAFLYMCAVSLLNFYQEDGTFQHLFRHFDHPLLFHFGVCFIVFTVAMCDTFAYFVGCAVGRHRFSAISPNKTVEGAVGGFCAAFITASVGWWLIANPVLPKGLGILLGILIGIFAQVGDLFVSLMKRYFSVKDSSQLIPGHGGVLDRFGSLFFTAPAVSIFTWVVNRFVAM